MTKPIIGVTLDVREPGGYSRYPWYAVRKNYVSGLTEHGATVFMLPHDKNSVNAYCEMLDGLLITGGYFDVNPVLYNASTTHPEVRVVPERTEFEWAMIEKMAAMNKPILGICGGQQIMNVVRGGSLIQHIPDEAPSSIEHSQEHCRTQPAHSVTLQSGTRLHDIVRKDKIDVNSVHHQAVKEVGNGLIVNAIADDGLIEGIEDPAVPCFIGVQWHPEFSVTAADVSLMAYFVSCCKNK